MSRDVVGLSQLAPLIASALISAGVGSYALYRRSTKGAPAFAFAALSQASWTLGYAFELRSDTLDAKLFWDDFQFLGCAGWALGFFAFAHTYGGVSFARLRWVWIAHGAVVGLYLGLVLTDRWHRLIRPEVKLLPGVPFDALVYPFTTATLAAFAYLLLIFALALGQLAAQFRSVTGVFQKQLVFVVAGAVIPLVGVTLTVLDVLPLFHRDTTPLTFALGNLLVAWGLFRHRLLDLVPIARNVLLEHLPDPVIVLDAQGRVLDLNPAAQSLTGDRPRQFAGKTCPEVFSGLPALALALEQHAATPVDVTLDIKGEQRMFAVSVDELRDPPRLLGWVAIAHDVSELKRVERELLRSNRELESANHELEAFAHSVSHDLRAPLRAISRFAEIALETQAARLDDRGREQLGLVREGTLRMRELIDALLSFSRSGRQPLTKRTIAPGPLAREVIEELRGTAAAREAEFDVLELPECSADQALLRQVFSNLIENALKYSRDRKPPRIAVGSLVHQGKPTYFVRDNGAGFDMKHKDRLFGVFQRLHDARQYEGTGVGLAIVQRIVTRHGGRIWAEAAVDGGATFYFTLEAGPAPE